MQYVSTCICTRRWVLLNTIHILSVRCCNNRTINLKGVSIPALLRMGWVPSDSTVLYMHGYCTLYGMSTEGWYWLFCTCMATLCGVSTEWWYLYIVSLRLLLERWHLNGVIYVVLAEWWFLYNGTWKVIPVWRQLCDDTKVVPERWYLCDGSTYLVVPKWWYLCDGRCSG